MVLSWSVNFSECVLTPSRYCRVCSNVVLTLPSACIAHSSDAIAADKSLPSAFKFSSLTTILANSAFAAVSSASNSAFSCLISDCCLSEPCISAAKSAEVAGFDVFSCSAFDIFDCISPHLIRF